MSKSRWLTTNKGPLELYSNMPCGKEDTSFTQMVLSQTEVYDILAWHNGQNMQSESIYDSA